LVEFVKALDFNENFGDKVGDNFGYTFEDFWTQF
jgi:hypothetical protein